MEDIFTIETVHSSGLYAKHPIAFVRGQGASLWDEQGREYVDCMGGHGVANLGHAHPAIVHAIAQQSSRLISLPETFYNDARSALMEKICSLVPSLDRVFFCNSGTEAVEAALKFARLSTGRPKIVAIMRGFHGRTLGALSATWNRNYRAPFEPLIPEFVHAPYNNVQALEEMVDTSTAAVILEVVQGEGGVHIADGAYLQAAREICKANRALLIIDEVQTGYGRTGKLFAIQHYGLEPDLLCLAKSIAGGLPMGAVLIGPEVKNLSPGMHGSTFGGNPLVSAAALATLDVMERERLPEVAAEKGAYLLERLRENPSLLVRDVRGLGLMIGIEIKKKVAPYLQAMAEMGVIAMPAGMTVIRLLPPLVIEHEQIERVIEVIRTVTGSDYG